MKLLSRVLILVPYYEEECKQTKKFSAVLLYVSSITKWESSGPYPRKAFVYLSSGISRFRNSFIPKHSV